MQKTKTKYTLFTNKALFMLILPIVVEAALTMSLGLADSFMVKGIGTNGTAVSAVTNVDQISNVMVQLFSAFGTGGAIITSQYLGAGKKEEANKSAKQLYVLMLLSSIVVMIVCLALNHQIIDLIYAVDDPAYKEYSYTYFYLMAASYPLLAIFYSAAAILRAQRKSMNTMTSAAVSFCLNVGLNALFIYGCEMGILGAALATFISRIFPAVFLSVLLANKKNDVRIKYFEKFRFDGYMIKKILILAIPSGIESCLFQIGKSMPIR
jgi:Na+-driven multidrug efflux pump